MATNVQLCQINKANQDSSYNKFPKNINRITKATKDIVSIL